MPLSLPKVSRDYSPPLNFKDNMNPIPVSLPPCSFSMGVPLRTDTDDATNQTTAATTSVPKATSHTSPDLSRARPNPETLRAAWSTAWTSGRASGSPDGCAKLAPIDPGTAHARRRHSGRVPRGSLAIGCARRPRMLSQYRGGSCNEPSAARWRGTPVD